MPFHHAYFWRGWPYESALGAMPPPRGLQTDGSLNTLRGTPAYISKKKGLLTVPKEKGHNGTLLGAGMGEPPNSSMISLYSDSLSRCLR